MEWRWIVFSIALLPSWVWASNPTYSIWRGATRGNVNTVGMAGAMTGLADNYSGNRENPAGSSLTLSGIQIQLTNSKLTDNYHFAAGRVFSNFTTGVAFPIDPWGFSLGYSIPFQSAHDQNGELALQEMHFSFSRSFLDHHLSLGMGVGHNLLQISPPNSPTESLVQWRVNFGGLYRFPRRIILGASFTPASLFGPDSLGRSYSIPLQAAVGVSWIPNRVFRSSLSLKWIAPEQTVVYRFFQPDQTVGYDPAGQFHLGMSYLFLSLKNIRAELYLGSYLETLRSTDPLRLHSTGGISIKPWLFSFSAGFDVARDYQNIMLSLGLDAFQVMRILKIFPRDIRPPPSGAFPNPIRMSDDWLPPRLQDHPEEAFQTIGPDFQDVKKGVESLPNNLIHPNNYLDYLYEDWQKSFD